LTGKLATVTDANGNVTRYRYDAVDRLSSLTDPVGRVTSYAYDALSRRTQILNTAVQASPLEQRAYTPDGLLASLTDANSNTTGYAYDGLDRLSTTTYPDTSTENLTYDADSNVLTRKTRKGDTITLTYDTLNRLKTKTPPSPAPVVTYAYDLAGRLTGVGDTSAAVTSAVPPSGSTVQYAANYTYDPLNRPVTVTWNPAPTQASPTASTASFNYTYERTNRRIGQTATDNSWWPYPTGPSTLGYTANALNQYSAVGAVTPTYDGNGDLTYDGTFTYAYDTENRLTTVSQGGSTVATYAYDAQDRRKTKTVGGTTTVFVTDADNREVLEYDGTSGAVQRWYAFGLGPDAVLNQMNPLPGTRATLIPDIQGSIVGTLDSGTGALTKTGYQPYGRTRRT
jgi:YD repeat-containing protein